MRAGTAPSRCRRPPHVRSDSRSVIRVDQRNDVHDFLASRPARITRAQVGLPVYSDKRRVVGLRREEVRLMPSLSNRVVAVRRDGGRVAARATRGRS